MSVKVQPRKFNQVEFEVKGDFGMFTTPESRLSGEKRSYPVPTFGALQGILEHVYWKPTFEWIIDEVRVMNEIIECPMGITGIRWQSNEKDVFYNTPLFNLHYQVRAHFEWAINRKKYKKDRVADKHYQMAVRYIERGGRRMTYFGTSEYPCAVRACKFGSGDGFYDNEEYDDFGLMFHGFTYADTAFNEETRNCISVRMNNVEMKNGIIRFVHPKDCSVIYPIASSIWVPENKKLDV